MFRMSPDADNKMVYYEKIAGDFTLDKRAAGSKNVILVGTGTGLAPFISMAKQLDFEAKSGASNAVKYTLLHTNRTYEELDYYQDCWTSRRRSALISSRAVGEPADATRLGRSETRQGACE